MIDDLVNTHDQEELPQRERRTLSSINLNYNYAKFRGFLETLCFIGMVVQRRP